MSRYVLAIQDDRSVLTDPARPAGLRAAPGPRPRGPGAAQMP
ncbi:hypothetical protein [Methylobacterium sp. CM6257]